MDSPVFPNILSDRLTGYYLEMRELLLSTASRANRYLEDIQERRVRPSAESIHGLDQFVEPFPEGPTSPEEVLDLLDDFGSPGTTGMAGPRFFGFVIGGVLPAALGASWLANAWDQCAGIFAASPTAAVVEEVSLAWLLDALHLPGGCGGAFVTGATMANFTALAAARNHILESAGWRAKACSVPRRSRWWWAARRILP
jgi:glutamate/tyrosine decarboxylase-like PLP-dependent enzyme